MSPPTAGQRLHPPQSGAGGNRLPGEAKTSRLWLEQLSRLVRPREAPLLACCGRRPTWHHLDWRRSAERRRYERYLQKRAQEAWTESGNRQEAAELAELRQGWALGSQVFRERMSDMVGALMLQRKRASYAGQELRRHDETAAQRLLDSGLQALGMELPDTRQLRQNDRRKQALAWLVKTQSIVGDEWVRQQLDMGDRSNVSRAVSAFRKETQPQIRRLKRHLHICTD